MLQFLQNQPKDVPIHLIHIIHNIYIPDIYNNPLSYLKKGSVIWVLYNEQYYVYELTSSISEECSEKMFLEELSTFGVLQKSL